MKRKIDHSKTNYPRENEENLVVFNAMIYEKELYYKIKNLEFSSVIRTTKKGNSGQEKRNRRRDNRRFSLSCFPGWGFLPPMLRNDFSEIGI